MILIPRGARGHERGPIHECTYVCRGSYDRNVARRLRRRRRPCQRRSKTLTYESGLAVRVVSAKVFKAGSYAVGLTAGHKAVKVTWTITNGTSANVDLAGAEARLTYGDDGVQAENVYTDGVGGQYPFEGSLQPGKRKTATTAFSVPKSGLAKISIEVEPEFMSETAFFTGKAT